LSCPPVQFATQPTRTCAGVQKHRRILSLATGKRATCKMTTTMTYKLSFPISYQKNSDLNLSKFTQSGASNNRLLLACSLAWNAQLEYLNKRIHFELLLRCSISADVRLLLKTASLTASLLARSFTARRQDEREQDRTRTSLTSWQPHSASLNGDGKSQRSCS